MGQTINDNPTFLVTGATGFIGGRLVERLFLEGRGRPRALVRNLSRAPRIARFPVDLQVGDLGDAAAVDAAVAGCDVVYHCAVDPRSVEQNVEGVRNLAEACIKHGVRRLVHLSTMGVYEPLPDGDADETQPTNPDGGYAVKLELETVLLSYYRERGLPVTILQPTIVYGPFGRNFTDRPVDSLLNGTIILPRGAEGLCNLVYVDDVVSAMLLAAEKDAAVGERFLVSGPEPVTWRDYYAAFERTLGVDAVDWMDEDEIVTSNSRLVPRVKAVLSDWRQVMRWQPARRLMLFVYERAGDRVKERALEMWRRPPKGRGRPRIIPDPGRLQLYKARTRIRIDKARRLLGYEPAFPFDRGMELTGAYIRWAFGHRFPDAASAVAAPEEEPTERSHA